MFALPADTPVIVPLAATVATELLLLTQVPPAKLVEMTEVSPTQMLDLVILVVGGLVVEKVDTHA